MESTGGQPFSIGRVLGRTFPIWARNVISFTILSAIIYSPLFLHAAFAMPPPPPPKPRVEAVSTEELLQAMREAQENTHAWASFQNVQMWSSLILGLMVTAAVIHGVFEQLRGSRVDLGACLRVCFGRFFPVLGVSVLTGLFAFLLAIPLGIVVVMSREAAAAAVGGVVVFVLEVVLFCALWVAVPAAVIERPGVTESLRRSAKLTKGSRFAIFVIALVLGVVLAAVHGAAGAFAKTNAGAVWVNLGVTVVVGALFAVANAVGYHDLRVAKEGIGVEDLVKVFA
jgi:hypothetical protein